MNDTLGSIVERIKQTQGRHASDWLLLAGLIEAPDIADLATLLGQLADRGVSVSFFATSPLDMLHALDVVLTPRRVGVGIDGYDWTAVAGFLSAFQRLGADMTGELITVILPRLAAAEVQQ